MGDENIEDKIYDADYQNALFSLNTMFNTFMSMEQYENAKGIYWTWKRFGDDYISFRLRHYDSEGRKVIKEVYDILGYNPYNPKQLNDKNE